MPMAQAQGLLYSFDLEVLEAIWEASSLNETEIVAPHLSRVIGSVEFGFDIVVRLQALGAEELGGLMKGAIDNANMKKNKRRRLHRPHSSSQLNNLSAPTDEDSPNAASGSETNAAPASANDCGAARYIGVDTPTK